MSIIIRKLQLDELETAADIFYRAFNAVGEEWTKDICLKRLHQYFNDDSCWAAEEDGKLIGFLTSKEDNAEDHQELYVDIIAVDPDIQKSGVGKQLLQTAEEYAKEKGYEAVWLSASSKLPSYNWYLKTGYEKTSWVALVKNLE